MKDDLQFNVRFLELIRAYPCLYDYNRTDYSNRNIQDAAWEDIAKTLQESVPECKERWKNIRGCYTRFLKKCNPSVSSAKSVKPYYLAEYLFFLDGFTKSRPSKGILNQTEPEPNNYPEPKTEPEPSQKSECTEEKKGISKLQDNPTCVKKFPKSAHSIKRISSAQNNKVIEKATSRNVKYFKSTQMKHNTQTQDPDLQFLYSVLPDMKDMNREQKRKFKVGVLNLAGEILAENPQYNNAPAAPCFPISQFSEDTSSSTQTLHNAESD